MDGRSCRGVHEIAHLSYKREAEAAGDRNWPFDVIAGMIGRAFRLFLGQLPAEHVADDFESRLRPTWPEYLDFPVAIGFPPDQHPKSVATKMFTGSAGPTGFEDLLT